MEPSSKRRRLAPKSSESADHLPLQNPPMPSQPSSSGPLPSPVSALSQPHAQLPYQSHQTHSLSQEQVRPQSDGVPGGTCRWFMERLTARPHQPLQHHAPPSDTSNTAPHPQRHEFEAFARHLQDAAMYILRETQRPQYTGASVLLLRWEEDRSVEPHVAALERVFRDVYHYDTTSWRIPTVPNPSIKLGVQMASFLEHARPDYLLIIYYAGHGFFGADNQLYWACNTRDDAAKLKWDVVRSLFEDAQSDMLLLLDSCAMTNGAPAGSHGLKQAIASCGLGHVPRDGVRQSFSAGLTRVLEILGRKGHPFHARRLYDELLVHQQQQAGLADGSGESLSPRDPVPVFFSLTNTNGHDVVMAPLPSRNSERPYDHTFVSEAGKGFHNSRLAIPGKMAALTFSEPRVLVCTTFVGEACPEMTFFNKWTQLTPPGTSEIAVEGMFIGPPTLLLISMPLPIWTIVQHDKVCCFLGYINSGNMINLYQRLMGSAMRGAATTLLKDVQDGRMPLEARVAQANTHGQLNSDHCGLSNDASGRRESNHRAMPAPSPSICQSAMSSAAAGFTHAGAKLNTLNGRNHAKEEVDESAEIKEAAEQLEALSHTQHINHSERLPPGQYDLLMEENIEVRHGQSHLSPKGKEFSDNENHAYQNGDFTGKLKHRRCLQRVGPKQDTQCGHCSHTPFKDLSSLRKHVAAAHTRPFPCAYSFAGCTSTFGSKNEWKRHIASQHLCLQYYRCSECNHATAEGKGNVFNRKDLFTQHLRRMHAPVAIKKALQKGGSKQQAEWDAHVKEMQTTCLVQRRQPPQRSACPKFECQSVFEGPESWDEWTEHVGRHMEKGDTMRLGVDRILAEWSLKEGIIERKDGKLLLAHSPGAPSERKAHRNGSLLESHV